MSHDLSNLWIRNEFREQEKKLNALEVAFDSLENQNSTFAKGIERMINLRKEILETIHNFVGGQP